MTSRIAIAALWCCLCAAAAAQDLVPHPAHVALYEGRLALDDALVVEGDRQALDSFLSPAVAERLPRRVTAGAGPLLSVTRSDALTDPEAYTLRVDAEGIHVEFATLAGAFYAGQTLLQLLAAPGEGPPRLPHIEVRDAPRFGWRGLMLDSSRHFQPVDQVLRFLDLMARHKLNVFHWHLTDGHGWRLESERYPELTARGAWRMQPGYPEEGRTERYGGFYTRDEIRRVVAYAAERHIRVVPEIDMPGHCFAFVAAYPQLGCLGVAQETDHLLTYPAREQRFPKVPGTDVLCVGKDRTLQVCKDLLDEALELFPSEFIHIGGDEVNKSFWRDCEHCQARKRAEGLADEDELQSWFIRQLDAHLTSRGRRLIGWDEILEGGLAENATVMSWRGEEGGIRAAKMGHDVVMTPQTHCYLDHGQSHSPLEPPHWPGHSPVERVYAYDPVPASLTPQEARHVLGVQGNVWTAFIHEEWLLDLQTWPRACAIAEVGWTPLARRDPARFRATLQGAHRRRLEALGVNLWWEQVRALGAWDPALLQELDGAAWELDVTHAVADLDGDELGILFGYEQGAHALRVEGVELLVDGEPFSRDVHAGFAGWRHEGHAFRLARPAGRGPELVLRITCRGDGGTDSRGAVTISSVETARVR